MTRGKLILLYFMRKRFNKILVFLAMCCFCFFQSCKSTKDAISIHRVKTETQNSELKNQPKAKQIENVDLLTRKKTLQGLPEGYILYEKITGDLNNDNIDDTILIVKGTSKQNIVTNRFNKVVDRNRRGILIYLTNNKGLYLATKNLNCFYSENEDGGVYYAPQLSFEIKNNTFFVKYKHGRHGLWKYTFKYQENDFKLIGFDHISQRGPITIKETSINFITKKKFIKENINPDENRNHEGFKETWSNFKLEKLYSLSGIKDFEELNFKNL